MILICLRCHQLNRLPGTLLFILFQHLLTHLLNHLNIYSNITAPVNTRHLSVSMTRSISQTRRNSNLLDAGRDSREYDSFSRARESSMSNRSSISELEFIE